MDADGRHVFHVVYGDNTEWKGKPFATMLEALADAMKKGKLK